VKIWKKGPRRWLRFSLLVAPVKKLREVFVLHPVTEKKPLSVFKNSFSFAQNLLGKRHAEQAKNGKK
jgi:hypothetical protein